MKSKPKRMCLKPGKYTFRGDFNRRDWLGRWARHTVARLECGKRRLRTRMLSSSAGINSCRIQTFVIPDADDVSPIIAGNTARSTAEGLVLDQKVKSSRLARSC